MEILAELKAIFGDAFPIVVICSTIAIGILALIRGATKV